MVWLIVISPTALKAAEPSFDLDHAQRLVDDVLALHLEPLGSRPNETWVFVRIQPTATSGKHYEGVITDPVTGYMTAQPGEQVALIHDGAIEVISPLIGIPQQTVASYKWKQPAAGGYAIGAHEVYLPFRQPSIAICQINEQAQDITKYHPLFLIPDDWQQYVLPAFHYCQTKPDIFSIYETEDNLEMRQQLLQPVEIRRLADPNPLIAIEMYRAFLQKYSEVKLPVEKARLLQTMAAQPDVIRQAALSALLLQWCQPAARPALQADFQKFISAANTSDQLEGIALGAIVTDEDYVTRRSINEALHEFAISILVMVGAKQAALGTHQRSDLAIDEMLHNKYHIRSPLAVSHPASKQ